MICIALLATCRSAIASSVNTASQKKLLEIAAREPFLSSQLGVLAITEGGDTLAALNKEMKMIPASNVKLLTTGVALRKLGGDFTFKTTLACSGNILDGTLHGDLYIIGGGDPTTGSGTGCSVPLDSLFGEWAGILYDNGITRIDGRILGDPRHFKMPDGDCGDWTVEDTGTYYASPVGGLNFYENAQAFYVAPGAAVGATPFVKARYPDAHWMTFNIKAVTGKPRTSNSLYYVGGDIAPVGEIRGSFPIDRKGYTLECDNHFGAYTCAFYFYKYLYNKGVTVTEGYGDISPEGKIRTDLQASSGGFRAPSYGSMTVLGSSKSAPLREIIRETNMDSNNFFAETIFHTLGQEVTACAEYDSCLMVVKSEFAAMGLDAKNACHLRDGCGLSRSNAVCAEFFVRFLTKMRQCAEFDSYLASLPVPGMKGCTLEHRFSKVPEETRNRIHLKTGSMNGVRCYSGYITPAEPGGQIIYVSVLSAGTTCTMGTSSAILEELIEVIARENTF